MCVEDVECMNDDPTSVDVLFAKVFLSDSSNRCVCDRASLSCTILLQHPQIDPALKYAPHLSALRNKHHSIYARKYNT